MDFLSDKERYRRLCEAEGERIPLFLRPWWMDAVCGARQWCALLAERGGKVAGAIPLLYGRKWGMPYALQPQMTMFAGPWLADNADSGTTDALAARLAALPASVCMVRLAPGMDAGEAFARHGFALEQRTTYRIGALRPLPELMAGASALRRRDFARCSALLVPDWEVPPAEMAAFHRSYQHNRGRRDLLEQGLMQRVMEAATAHGCGLVTGARNHAGELQAAVFVAYDSQCAYLLLLARRLDAPRNAMASLIWLTIEHLTPLTRTFDFEGGTEAGVGQFYRSFGAEPASYLQASRFRPPLLRKLIRL